MDRSSVPAAATGPARVAACGTIHHELSASRRAPPAPRGVEVMMGQHGQHLTENERREIRRELLTSGETPTALARRRGWRANTVQRIKRQLVAEGLLSDGSVPLSADGSPEGTPASAATPEAERRERHDASFWKHRAQRLQKDLAAAEHVAEELAGVRSTLIQVPDWIMSERQGRVGSSVPGFLLSDIHAGEVISEEEILGINAFNPDICRQRLRRYFNAGAIIGQRWASDTAIQGALLALAGDLISGDIHEELRITNALTAHEQVQLVVEEGAAGIRVLREAFGRVHVVGVPGNHGRTTIKPTAKLYSRLSYDTLIVSMIAERFKDDDRITFQYGASKDQITPIFGRTVFTTHGDKIGTKGGMGFAGPNLPIVRGSKKIEAQQASIGRRPDLIQFGHYHISSNPGSTFANGSVPGYTEYSDDLRSVVEPPQQWAYLLHSRWWLRERCTIQLEDPREPPKPRVRIPAGMSERV